MTEREKFVAWLESLNPRIPTTHDVEVAWRGWQAATKVSKPPTLAVTEASIREEVLKAFEEIAGDDAGQEAYGYTDPGLALNRCQQIAREQIHALKAKPAPESGVTLDELAKHKNWELSYGETDAGNDEYGWRVHERSGNINDREWDLIGFGETPTAALQSAMEERAKG